MNNLSNSVDFNCRGQISQDRMVGCMVRIILEIADDPINQFSPKVGATQQKVGHTFLISFLN